MGFYTIKCNVDGIVERYKVRLVAKKFTQTYEINFLETLALNAKIKVLLSLVA